MRRRGRRGTEDSLPHTETQLASDVQQGKNYEVEQN
jgi:hypothetical protein